jgi:hypothetical protein
MNELNGYDNGDFASYSQEAPHVQQLPSLPIDDVLPKADKDINTKKVKFMDEEPNDDPHLQTIIPQEKTQQPVIDRYKQLYDIVVENSIYIFIVFVLLFAYLYTQYY